MRKDVVGPSSPLPTFQGLSESVTETPAELGRGLRRKRPTWKILESLPQPAAPIVDDTDAVIPVQHGSESPPRPISFPRTVVRSPPNVFGLYREYSLVQGVVPSEDLCSISAMSYTQGASSPAVSHITTMQGAAAAHNEAVSEDSLQPNQLFSNETTFCLMNWMWTGSNMKSQGELT